MEGKNAQESTEKSKVFQIPIENFEKDMNTESAKEKKKEILELLTTYNKLRSKEEYLEIRYTLHRFCEEGDLEMIKIFLRETIGDSTRTFRFKIDETNQTASLFQIKTKDEEVYIPRTVEHESTEYLITSISRTISRAKKIKFCEDSAVKTFYKNAFSDSLIEEIYFPDSLKELKERWCYGTRNLNRIIISPSNGQFEFKEDKYLICKSDSNNDEFDKLLFVRRDIEEFSIPSNIKIISSCSFSDCYNLKKVKIPTNSNLQTIESNAFLLSKIESIFIPSSVSKICEYAFAHCRYLIKVEIPTNSNLQTIEQSTFIYSKIRSIFIPSSVSKICEYAFAHCRYLIKVEIPTNSNLQTIESNAFLHTDIESIYIPSNVSKICESAFLDCDNLKKIEIPTNSNLQTIESYAFEYSNIESIYIPSKISKISESAFLDCENLKIMEISEDSELESESFLLSINKQLIIMIPSSSKIFNK